MYWSVIDSSGMAKIVSARRAFLHRPRFSVRISRLAWKGRRVRPAGRAGAPSPYDGRMAEALVVDWDPAWPERAAEEAAAVGEVLGATKVEHIGSTSIAGLSAKPVLDLLAGLRPLEVGAASIAAMEALGYEYLGEHGLPGRLFFRKGPEQRTHHVHAVELGGTEWRRHLAFRDYLRAHPEEAARYGEAKRALARAVEGDWEAYTDRKAGIASDIQTRALAWAAATNWRGPGTESAQPGTDA